MADNPLRIGREFDDYIASLYGGEAIPPAQRHHVEIAFYAGAALILNMVGANEPLSALVAAQQEITAWSKVMQPTVDFNWMREHPDGR